MKRVIYALRLAHHEGAPVCWVDRWLSAWTKAKLRKLRLMTWGRP